MPTCGVGRLGRRWRPTTRLAADTLARGCTEAWVKDIVAVNQCKGPGLHFPIIADPERTVAHALGMIDEKARDAADVPLTCRAVYIVGPDKKLKLSLLYPASTGRNFGEDRSATSTRSLQSTSRTPPPPSPSPCPSPSPSPCSRPHSHAGPPRARLVTAYGHAQPCHPCELEARRQVHGVIMRIALRSFVSHRIHSRLSDKGIWRPNSLCACRCSPNSPPLRPRTSSRRGSRYTRCHRSESTCDSYAAHPARPHRGCRARPQLGRRRANIYAYRV